MKGIIRLLLLVVALTTFCGTISAQTGKQRLTREQLAFSANRQATPHP